MGIIDFLLRITDPVLFGVCVFILLGSLYITFKMRFVQVRLLPFIYKKLRATEEKSGSQHSVTAKKALFTAMSTTLGITTIVGPPIAIKLGGPGALIGFLLMAFFGSAVTYVEVCLSMHYRKQLLGGAIMGGPMQYLKALLSHRVAKCYAICCLILLMGWSAAQTNQLAAILHSPALGSFRVPVIYSGIFFAVFTLFALKGGVRWLGSFSAKLVPTMFVLYVGSSLWIILWNWDLMGTVLGTIFRSAFQPYALASGVAVGGIVSALRWGIFKGVQATEAGMGTQTIPHSMAQTQDPMSQAALSMLSTFSAGGLAFLSGCVALMTNTWQDPSLALGIHMVLASYQQYFSFAGVIIVAISAFLFGLGTILGNCFNASQCYGYLTNNRRRRYYFMTTGIMIFLGAVSEVKTVWAMVDILVAIIAIPHMFALLLGVHKSPELFLVSKEKEPVLDT